VPTSSGQKSKPNIQGESNVRWLNMHVFAFSAHYFSTLKMEAVRSSETSVNFCKILQPHVPKDSSLSNQVYLTMLSQKDKLCSVWWESDCKRLIGKNVEGIRPGVYCTIPAFSWRN
jgi:hypothetical protein